MRSELNEVKQKKWTANPWNLKDISFFLYATARENRLFSLATAMEPSNNYNLKLDCRPQSPIFSSESQDQALFPLYQAASVGGV